MSVSHCFVVVLATTLAVFLTLAVPSAGISPNADQFGRPLPPRGDRSMDTLGYCAFAGYARWGAENKLYDIWTCDSGALVIWPSECSDDPSTPCQEI